MSVISNHPEECWTGKLIPYENLVQQGGGEYGVNDHLVYDWPWPRSFSTVKTDATVTTFSPTSPTARSLRPLLGTLSDVLDKATTAVKRSEDAHRLGELSRKTETSQAVQPRPVKQERSDKQRRQPRSDLKEELM